MKWPTNSYDRDYKYVSSTSSTATYKQKGLAFSEKSCTFSIVKVPLPIACEYHLSIKFNYKCLMDKTESSEETFLGAFRSLEQIETVLEFIGAY